MFLIFLDLLQWQKGSNMEDHKTKKPTKKQAIQNVKNETEKILKDSFVKNMILGSDVAYRTILEYIEKGHTIKDVKEFCQMNINHKDAMERATTNKKENN